MSKKTGLRVIVQVPPVPQTREQEMARFLESMRVAVQAIIRSYNLYIDADIREFVPSNLTSLAAATGLPDATYVPFNTKGGEDGNFRKVDVDRSSWAMRFDAALDLMEILYAAAGVDPITWTTLWTTSSTGTITFSQNIRWKSGTAFFGELDHANTANRTYTYPDATGTLPLKESNETVTGTWTFDALLTLKQNLRWASGTTTFYGTLDHANTADRTYTFPDATGTVPLLERNETVTGTWTFNALLTLLQNLRWASGTSTFYGTLDHANTVDRTYTFPDKSGTVAMTDDGPSFADSATIDFTVTPGSPPSVTAVVIQSGLDHGTIGGLADDDHTQYVLLAGRSGGQTAIGGTAAGNDLKLQSTSNATRGDVEVGQGSDGAVVAASGGRLSFYGGATQTKTAVADMGALATTETADATYDVTEQAMLNNLKTDVTSLRSKVNELLDVLQGLNLV